MSQTVCRCCGDRADVAVHVQADVDPFLYCDPCRTDDRPEDRFAITGEFRLTRRALRAWTCVCSLKGGSHREGCRYHGCTGGCDWNMHTDGCANPATVSRRRRMKVPS